MQGHNIHYNQITNWHICCQTYFISVSQQHVKSSPLAIFKYPIHYLQMFLDLFIFLTFEQSLLYDWETKASRVASWKGFFQSVLPLHSGGSFALPSFLSRHPPSASCFLMLLGLLRLEPPNSSKESLSKAEPRETSLSRSPTKTQGSCPKRVVWLAVGEQSFWGLEQNSILWARQDHCTPELTAAEAT